MSEIDEAIQESVAHAGESKINSRIAIFVAVTATFMALCNIKDGNVVQSMSQAQANSIDAWSYFQAKSTKEAITENTVEWVKLQNLKGSDTVISRFEGKIDQYEKEKNDIKKQAEGYQKQYEDINVFDDQFDMAEALLSIAIALFGITALTQKRWLLFFAAFVSLVGITLGVTAFLRISLHSEFISKLLG